MHFFMQKLIGLMISVNACLLLEMFIMAHIKARIKKVTKIVKKNTYFFLAALLISVIYSRHLFLSFHLLDHNHCWQNRSRLDCQFKRSKKIIKIAKNCTCFIRRDYIYGPSIGDNLYIFGDCIKHIWSMI